jgi:hypothetical protein
MQLCSLNHRNAAGRSTASRFGAMLWAVVLFWGIALVTSSFQTAFANIAPDAGTVYCPLQKRFVLRSEPVEIVSVSTTEYCAPPRETEEFNAKLIRNVGIGSISDQDEADLLFFAYKANSERAFRGFSGTPDDPKTPSSSVDQTKNAVISSSNEVTPAAVVAFYFETASSISSTCIPIHADLDVHTSTAQYISDPQRGPPAN